MRRVTFFAFRSRSARSDIPQATSPTVFGFASAAGLFLSGGSDVRTITDAFPVSTFGNLRLSSRLVPMAVISASDMPAGMILQSSRFPSELQRTIS